MGEVTTKLSTVHKIQDYYFQYISDSFVIFYVINLTLIEQFYYIWLEI